ncbi:transposase, IS605 OrfB family, central region [Xenococcus sp. PCC 7305]|uniref:RNA-guided endonuclease InsQ/TnpB family protein n=1 Tax=Xenococcus sp. PCC 7305 TaxID=102125 RepID=UPI0002AC7007|nr:RNA-guided endonuclease TnpB family protein [Xenococcus sp. PCC 7305]ELS01186.1 transposase, IS605 OrfB family, central region [Xenococcus sp. PCC 7305]
MIYNYQYRLNPTTEQKLIFNDWLRVCRYWYNRQLGERFDWWERNRSYIDRCPLVCHLPELKDKPEFYGQKKQLPILKQDLVAVGWSGELLDFSSVPANTLQEVGKRVQLAFKRFIAGDKNGKRSGKPRFKNQARFRSMVFEGVKLHSCSVGGKFLYISLPKMGLIKLRHHRPLPDGVTLKSAQVIKKTDGWYINLRLQDDIIPDFKADIIPTWENSMGMDAVLHESDYLATSEGAKLPSLKSFRKAKTRLAKVSQRKSQKTKGSKSRRKLAKKEARLHQRIARSRKDHAYNTAQALLDTGKQVFFHEKLNLKGLSRRNKPKTDDNGKYIPNGQSAKSGLNLSWADAGFGQFFKILEYKAGKAGAIVKEVNPAYTSQLLSYRDDFIFTDCSIREYWDEELKLLIDRDINAGINIKRVGLDVFPTIKRRRGNPVVTNSATDSTSKEVLLAHQLWATGKPTPSYRYGVGASPWRSKRRKNCKSLFMKTTVAENVLIPEQSV